MISSYFERKESRDWQLGLRAWDGSTAGNPDGPTIVMRSPQAMRRSFRRPGPMSLARSYIDGDIEVEGDLTEVFRLAPESLLTGGGLGMGARARLLAHGARHGGPGRGYRRRRDASRSGRGPSAAVTYPHYDAGNDFYARMLGHTMVYSCAYWPEESHAADPTAYLGVAQRAKLDLVCRKLGLRPGMRLLDAGCGWGSLACYAAENYGVHVVGVTLSGEQVRLARGMLAARGLGDRVEIRLGDLLDVTDGPYDAVACVEVAHHLSPATLRDYAALVHRVLAPGGRLLDHRLTVSEPDNWRAGLGVLQSYVLPDFHATPLAQALAPLEEAGLEVVDVENLRAHMAPTLRAWQLNLEDSWGRAVLELGEKQARAWRLYLAGSSIGFDAGLFGLHHIVAMRPSSDGVGRLAARRALPSRARDILAPSTA